MVVWEADTTLLHILWLFVTIPLVTLKGISLQQFTFDNQ